MTDSNGYSPSIVEEGKCFICGRGYDLVRHEVYHGANRQKSKRLGLWCNLCTHCHYEVHNGRHNYDAKLKEKFQPLAMAAHGWSIEDFIKNIGKNYLEEK